MGQRAATYKRISSDREGRELGVIRQNEDVDELARRLGLEVVADLTDNDIGASTRSRKERPGYRKLLAGARAGDYEVILAYTSSRLTRRPREHEDLIDLAEHHGIRFEYVRSPSFDLNTADGRAVARTLAAWDAAEAERAAERIQRAVRQRAERGEWHGGTSPQFLDLVRDERGRVVTVELNETYAGLLREAARRALDGEALHAVCQDWQRRGIRTRTGGRWRQANLRNALVSAAAIGKREYDGVLYDTGQDGGEPWPAALDRDTWDRLRELFADPSRRAWAPPPGVSNREGYAGKRALGGGLTVCGLCGRPLISATKDGRPRLVCHPAATDGCGKVAVAYEPLEEFITDMVLARLDSPEFHRELASRRSVGNGREQALRDDLAALERRRERAQAAYLAEIMTEAEARAEVRKTERLRDEARGKLDRLEAGRVRAEVTDPAEARRLLASADVLRRRRFLRGLIEMVTIDRWPSDLPTTLTRRRGESDEDLATRRRENLRAALRTRVEIRWRR